jgi:hypothetical protein
MTTFEGRVRMEKVYIFQSSSTFGTPSVLLSQLRCGYLLTLSRASKQREASWSAFATGSVWRRANLI